MNFKWRAVFAAVCLPLIAGFHFQSQTPNPITPQPIIPTATATLRPPSIALIAPDDARAAVCAAHTLPNFAPHIVAPGDTIAGLLDGADVITVTQAAALNCIDDPNALPVGAVIYLPPGVQSGTPQPCAYEWMDGIENSGCAPSPIVTSVGAVQRFQHGIMVWMSETSEIYVLLPRGRLLVYVDTYVEGMSDPAEVAPEGFRTPIRGFGMIWAALGGSDSLIGWALDPEIGTQFTLQSAGRISYTTYLQLNDALYAFTRYPGAEQGFWSSVE